MWNQNVGSYRGLSYRPFEGLDKLCLYIYPKVTIRKNLFKADVSTKVQRLGSWGAYPIPRLLWGHWCSGLQDSAWEADYISIYIYTYVDIRMHVHIYMFMSMYIYICLCICIRISTCICVHTLNRSTCIYIYIYILPTYRCRPVDLWTYTYNYTLHMYLCKYAFIYSGPS